MVERQYLSVGTSRGSHAIEEMQEKIAAADGCVSEIIQLLTTFFSGDTPSAGLKDQSLHN